MLGGIAFTAWTIINDLPEPPLEIHATYHPPRPPDIAFQRQPDVAVAKPSPAVVAPPVPIIVHRVAPKSTPTPDGMVVVVNGRQIF
jgi:hypothetical protein